MSQLACRTCGRSVYTVAPLEALSREERRCPRCGAFLSTERRAADRRGYMRRSNPAQEPGPPSPAGERRVVDRRSSRRRGSGPGR